MTPRAFDYHSISYGVHAQCAAFDTVRITSIRRANRRCSVKLANNREEGVIYRSEKLASFHTLHTLRIKVKERANSRKLQLNMRLWAGGIIGPYFFKNDEGHNVTVNGDRYRAMITNFFIPELNNHDVQELWFQQDGATCHTARATIDLLKDTFGDRLISRFGPVNGPPRSCDLTPLDYFLWVYVKSLVYADKPQTLDHLEDNIRRVIADIRPQMLEKVIENWTSRLDYIRASRGSPMPEIIFKIASSAIVQKEVSFANIVKNDKQMAPPLDKSEPAQSKPEATPTPLKKIEIITAIAQRPSSPKTSVSWTRF
ncbi:uncharacterized protein TNCV_2231791 [Trichonephila clavipes]|nr:uncharacterized protein TNCV_2231791 [Trichonephila clavipes]